jgi:uncharacterized protein YwqG
MMTDKVTAYIDQYERPCILLRPALWQGAEQRRSWFGGYPLRGQGAPWPQHPDHGDMPFLAQIDLAELAAAGVDLPEGLPVSGLLVFFYDLTCTETGTTQLPVVEYWPDGTALIKHQPSGPLRMAKAYYDLIFSGSVFNYLRQKGPRVLELDHYPKYAMDMIPARDLPMPRIVYDRQTRRQTYPDGFEDISPIQDALAAHRQAALADVFGRDVAQRRQALAQGPRAYTDSAPFLDPKSEFSPRRPVTSDLDPSLPRLPETFPLTWGGLALFFIDCFPGARSWCEDGTAQIKKTQQEALAWREKACAQPPHDAVPEQDRQAFQAWVKARWRVHAAARLRNGLRANGRKARWLKRLGLGRYVPADLGAKDPDFKTRSLLGDGLYACVDDLTLLCDGETGLGDMPDQIRTLAADMIWGSYSHQALGYGENVQNAAEEHRDKVLLFEAATSKSLMWMFGDCGKYQVWISSEDLRAGHWHKAFATLEGG